MKTKPKNSAKSQATVEDQNTPQVSKVARRVAYSVAAAAAGSAASDALAVPFYSGVMDTNIAPTTANTVDIDLDGNFDILLKNYVFGGGPYQGATINFGPGRFVAEQNGFVYANKLNAGDIIDDTTIAPAFTGPPATNYAFASLSYGAYNPNAEFTGVAPDTEVTGFLGFAFPIGGALEENLHYGWMRVTIDNSQGIFVINDWAYNTIAGVGIEAGDTGLPGGYGDFNGDGVVDGADYALWRNNLGGDQAALNGQGETDGDNATVVDADDLNLWSLSFNPPQPPPAPEVVASATAAPEPGTLGLLAAGSLGLPLMRRRDRKSGTQAG
ncbi:MAG: PEP-CTERM sorting domain-containing protein [Planctomycetota bacterium]